MKHWLRMTWYKLVRNPIRRRRFHKEDELKASQDFLSVMTKATENLVEKYYWDEARTRSIEAEERSAANEKTLEFVLKQIQILRKRTESLASKENE